MPSMIARRGRLSYAALAVALLVFLDANAALDAAPAAFPGAEGFGAMTPGGRGGRVIEVVNLDPKGPGSLQAACDAKGPRIVVFRVSGIIEGTVRVREPFITIAGQTAPGDGICLRRGMLVINAHDVIVRYIRSRPGDHPLGPSAGDRDCIALSGDDACNVIIDHCSASWGIDENVQNWGRNRNVTIQWCIISEPLDDSLHPKGPHGKGLVVGHREVSISVHHCLFAHNLSRNPEANFTKSETPGVFDFVNNVLYNHGQYVCGQVHGALRMNYVGNVIKLGPNGAKATPRGLEIFGHDRRTKVYVRDNIWPGMAAEEKDDWLVVGSPIGRGGRTAPRALRLSEPAEAPAVSTEPAAQAYESVLRHAGCTRPVRDVVDARIVAEVLAASGRIIDSQHEVGGWPSYAATPPLPDSDHDAMPDAWEKRYGFNPKDASDGPKDADRDGYTNVEEFLNQTDPARPDTGAPVPHQPASIQSGNHRIRGEAARRIGFERVAELKKCHATEDSLNALLARVRESRREVADVLGVTFVRIPLPANEFTVFRSRVKLTKPFELSACEITQAQWEAVMGTRPWANLPGAGETPQCPANYITHVDALEFVRRLSACGVRSYRLPTRAEWDWAARGGTDSGYGFGDDKWRVSEYAWCVASLRGKDNHPAGRRSPAAPQAVGRMKPNPYGLYDMAGNVREWCHEWYDFNYYYYEDNPTKTDPMGPSGPGRHSCRVACGGYFRSWHAEVLHPRRRALHHRPHYSGCDMGLRLRRAAPRTIGSPRTPAR